MEANFKCRKGTKGIIYSAGGKNNLCDFQRTSASHPNGEAKFTCRGCKRESPVPSNTTVFHCPLCQTITTSSVSENGQSNKDSGNRMMSIKFRASGFRLDDLPENADKNLFLPNQRTSSVSSEAKLTYRVKNPHLQNQISPSFSSIGSSLLSRRCNKRAVLCGVTYRKRKYRLKRTINDVLNMKELLVKVFDFPTECIRLLTEQAEDYRFVPTKKNILDSMKWLVEGCQSGYSLVFYFSGHGLQHQDIDGDESDGMDESICPVDFLREGTILNDDINSILVWPLKEGVTLHAIVDACHSGTILDLRYVYDPKDCNWMDSNKPPAKESIKKHTSGGRAICISFCEDSQMAADTTAFRAKGMNGVMTYLFTKIIKQNPNITYKGLQEKMHEEVQDVIRNSCHHKFLQHIFRPKIKQDLLISSSEKFDVSKRILTL